MKTEWMSVTVLYIAQVILYVKLCIDYDFEWE